jgi:hypothetical protein
LFLNTNKAIGRATDALVVKENQQLFCVCFFYPTPFGFFGFLFLVVFSCILLFYKSLSHTSIPQNHNPHPKVLSHETNPQCQTVRLVLVVRPVHVRTMRQAAPPINNKKPFSWGCVDGNKQTILLVWLFCGEPRCQKNQTSLC